MSEWEDIDEPGEPVGFRTTIECTFEPEPDPVATALYTTGGVILTAIAMWLIVRIINRREEWAIKLAILTIGLPTALVAFGFVFRWADVLFFRK
jgi:hypothetical protein